MSPSPFRVCVICSGNICRSPMAEVVLRDAFDRVGMGELVEVDSAGTGDWHIGEQADQRALAALTRAGYDGSQHRARQFDREWFAERDLVLVADSGHLRVLRSLAPDERSRERVRLLRSFDDDADQPDLADPYYGDDEGFSTCLHQVEAAAPGIVRFVNDEVQARRSA